MLRIFALEWLKIKYAKPFWIMLGLFVLCYSLIGLFSKSAIDFLVAKGPPSFKAFLQTGLPIFDFVDIWQNLAYLGSLFKWILGFIVIISITNEFSNRTVRQNIIDGLSKYEFLKSKLLLIATLSALNVLLIFVLGIVLGYMYSPVTSLTYVFQEIIYLPLVFVEIFGFLCLAMLFAVVIRRSGFALVLFMMYTLFIENFVTAYFYYQLDWPIWYFPFRAVNNLIHFPLSKYALQYVPTGLNLVELGLALFWIGSFMLISYRVLDRRDL